MKVIRHSFTNPGQAERYLRIEVRQLMAEARRDSAKVITRTTPTVSRQWCEHRELWLYTARARYTLYRGAGFAIIGDGWGLIPPAIGRKEGFEL